MTRRLRRPVEKLILNLPEEEELEKEGNSLVGIQVKITVKLCESSANGDFDREFGFDSPEMELL